MHTHVTCAHSLISIPRPCYQWPHVWHTQEAASAIDIPRGIDPGVLLYN